MLSKKRKMLLFAVLLIPAVALIMSTAATEVWAEDCELEFNVFAEFNSTDLDLGIHFFWDGPAWRSCVIYYPDGEEVQTISNDWPEGQTECAIEGAEPEQETMQAIRDFLREHPNGTYTINCVAIDTVTCPEPDGLEGEANLRYQLLNAAELEVEDFPEVTWTETGNVSRAEIVIEAVLVNGDERERTEKVIYDGGIGQHVVSEVFLDFIEANIDTLEELKAEVLIDDGFNKTITETPICWTVNGAIVYSECLDED